MTEERKNEIRSRYPQWAAICDFLGWPGEIEGVTE